MKALKWKMNLWFYQSWRKYIFHLYYIVIIGSFQIWIVLNIHVYRIISHSCLVDVTVIIFKFHYLYILGEEPAAIQSSGANRIFSFPKPYGKSFSKKSLYIVPYKTYFELSFLLFLLFLSQKLCLFLSTSLPIINKSRLHTCTTTKAVTITKTKRTNLALCESLQLSERKQNNVDAICILSWTKSSLQNGTTATTSHSSCHKNSSSSSWPGLKTYSRQKQSIITNNY